MRFTHIVLSALILLSSVFAGAADASSVGVTVSYPNGYVRTLESNEKIYITKGKLYHFVDYKPTNRLIFVPAKVAEASDEFDTPATPDEPDEPADEDNDNCSGGLSLGGLGCSPAPVTPPAPVQPVNCVPAGSLVLGFQPICEE